MPVQTPQPQNQNQTPQPAPSPTPHQQATLRQAQSGPDMPVGATPTNPSGAYGTGRRGRPRSTAKVRVNNGVEEHRHPGADYWHPVERRHGRRGMSDQERQQVTERMHMAAGLGRDGRGGDTVQRTEMSGGLGGRTKDRMGSWAGRTAEKHPGLANTGAVAAIAGVALAKGLAMNAADIADKTFSGIRNAVNACMSPNPLSAAGSIMVDSLAKASDTSKRMMDIQRRYGIGNPDGQSLESTIAGRMMLKDQQIAREGSQRALASISDMMERTGASDVNNMDSNQLQAFANENVLRMEDIMRRLDEDSAQPSSRRMSRAERQGLIEELRVHRDMNSQIAGRSKDIRSDAKEMAARIGHQRQYLNQMASVQRREDRARLAQEAQARFAAMPAWGQEISRQVGARVHLDADGVPTNPARRTAARRVLDTERDRAERELRALQGTRTGDPARAEELRRRIDSMNEGIDAIDRVDTREREQREAEKARARQAAEEERRRAREQGVIDRRRELAGASDFTDPDFNPSEYIMRRTGVYDSDRGLDPHLVPQGAFNNPKIRQNLQSTNLQWEQWAREQGIDLTQDPRYISSKNTETAMSAKDHMDHVTKQLDHIATMSDDDLEKYFPGASRERLEEDLRKVYEQYDMDRTEFPVDDIAARGRDMTLIPKDRARAFQDNLNALEEKWGLTRYARQPRGQPKGGDGEQEQTTAGAGDGDGDAGRRMEGTRTLPQRIAAEPLAGPQETQDAEGTPEPVTEPVVAPEASGEASEPIPETTPQTEVPPVTMNAGPGDTPIYPEGRPYEYEPYTYMTDEGERTGYRRIPVTDTVSDDVLREAPAQPAIEGDIYDYLVQNQDDARQIADPVATAAEDYGQSVGEQMLDGSPSETVPVDTPEEVQAKVEEGIPAEAPTTDDLGDEDVAWDDIPGVDTAKGRRGTKGRFVEMLDPDDRSKANEVIASSVGQGAQSKYMIDDATMAEFAQRYPNIVRSYIESKKDGVRTGADAYDSNMDTYMDLWERKLKERGVDTSQMNAQDLIRTIYETSPPGSKERRMAVQMHNDIQFRNAYNMTVQTSDKGRRFYEPYAYKRLSEYDEPMSVAGGTADEGSWTEKRITDEDLDNMTPEERKKAIAARQKLNNALGKELSRFDVDMKVPENWETMDPYDFYRYLQENIPDNSDRPAILQGLAAIYRGGTSAGQAKEKAARAKAKREAEAAEKAKKDAEKKEAQAKGETYIPDVKSNGIADDSWKNQNAGQDEKPKPTKKKSTDGAGKSEKARLRQQREDFANGFGNKAADAAIENIVAKMTQDGGDEAKIGVLWRARKKEDFADKVEALTAVNPKLARAVQNLRDEAHDNPEFGDKDYEELFKGVSAYL